MVGFSKEGYPIGFAHPLSKGSTVVAQQLLCREHALRQEIIGDQTFHLTGLLAGIWLRLYVCRYSEGHEAIGLAAEVFELERRITELAVVGQSVEGPANLRALLPHESFVGCGESGCLNIEECLAQIGTKGLDVLKVDLVGPFQIHIDHIGLRSFGHEMMTLHIAHAPSAVDSSRLGR